MSYDKRVMQQLSRGYTKHNDSLVCAEVTVGLPSNRLVGSVDSVRRLGLCE